MAGKTEYKNQFAAEKYDRFSLMLPKGSKSRIKEAADNCKMSVNGFINSAIDEKLIKNGFEPISKKTDENKESDCRKT